MFAFGVPVPGTINAVAARLTAAVNAVTTPRTTELSIPRTNKETIRADLCICQRSHSGGVPVSKTRKFDYARFVEGCRILAAPFVGGVESGTEGFCSLPEGDHDALLRPDSRPSAHRRA